MKAVFDSNICCHLGYVGPADADQIASTTRKQCRLFDEMAAREAQRERDRPSRVLRLLEQREGGRGVRLPGGHTASIPKRKVNFAAYQPLGRPVDDRRAWEACGYTAASVWLETTDREGTACVVLSRDAAKWYSGA